MRKIEAILDPDQLDAVNKALRLIGVTGMTVCEVKANRPGASLTTRYRGSTYYAPLQPKLRLEIVVDDSLADAVVRRLVVTANRGGVSEGTIAVLPIQDAVRIRTKEHGPGAI
jgi:nitrogen regulatory protein P-II 1